MLKYGIKEMKNMDVLKKLNIKKGKGEIKNLKMQRLERQGAPGLVEPGRGVSNKARWNINPFPSYSWNVTHTHTHLH